MPRISIYVPDDMKARMDGAGERANWSAVAQRAFDFELNHLETIKEIKSMSDVTERLRASKQKFIEETAQEGRQDGAEWAKQYAEYDELRLIAVMQPEELTASHAEGGAYTAAEIVYMTVRQDDSRPAADELAEIFGDDVERLSPEYVAAFVEGAADVWVEVKDQI